MKLLPLSGVMRFGRWAPKKRVEVVLVLSVILFAVAGVVLLFYFLRTAGEFPPYRVVKVEEGSTVREIADQLKEEGIIRSAWVLRLLLKTSGGERRVIAGDYFFDQDESLIRTAFRLTRGYFGSTPIKVTIPEGFSSAEIAELLRKKLPSFQKGEFLSLAREKEGYLFPDTYFFSVHTTPPQVVAVMERNFYRKIQNLQPKISVFGKPLNDIVTMASLIEEEARKLQTRKIISGILWKRLELDMPLQVDAVFPYINGKNSFTLTLKDLQIDSPYNTYRYKGLPKGPISNPGLDSLLAAVEPLKSEYLYYLTDGEGRMRYAETFDEHVDNKARHLW